MISDLKRLEEVFLKMDADGFQTSMPLKWGFYFVDSTEENLKRLYGELEEKGYELSKLARTTDNYWQMSVNKIDTLTPLKLNNRNIAFNELAKHCNVGLYDGWDVEKV